MKRDISKKRVLPHPIEHVWHYLTQPQQSDWLGKAELDLKEGGRVKFEMNSKAFTGEILTVQEPINLAYSWNDPGHNFTTYVWWKLMDQKGKTLLELEHSGFRGLMGILASYSYQTFWNKKFKQLENSLNKTASIEA